LATKAAEAQSKAHLDSPKNALFLFDKVRNLADMARLVFVGRVKE
jgi:hypothetical protein